MFKVFKYWWNAIPHHNDPQYFNVVTAPISISLFLIGLVLLAGMWFGPENPHQESLQSFSSISK